MLFFRPTCRQIVYGLALPYRFSTQRLVMVSFDQLPNGQTHLGAEKCFLRSLPFSFRENFSFIEMTGFAVKAGNFLYARNRDRLFLDADDFLRCLGVDLFTVFFFFHFPAVPSSRPIIHLFAGNAAHIFTRIFFTYRF